MLNKSFILVFLIFLAFSVMVQAAEIDPYKYSLTIGWIDSLEGEAYLTGNNGETAQMQSKETVRTDRVNRLTLTYNDNGITLIDGRKDMEDTLILKTGPTGKLKLSLNDLDNNESYLLLDNNTEIELNVKGGLTYSTDRDGEGYDRSTLKWRPVNPYLYFKVLSGKLRVYYRPNGQLRLGAPSTKNAEIRVNETEIEDYLEYEMEILTGDAAKQVGVDTAGLEDEINQQTQDLMNNYFELYKVDSIDELNPEIKGMLMSQLEILKEAQKEMSKNMAEMSQSGMIEDIVTVLKVYHGKVSLYDTLVTDGELSRVKGQLDRASRPESF